MKISISDLEKTLKTKAIGVPSNTTFNGVSIDSRTTKENNIFFAIKGDNHDGHDYIEDALKNGAKAIICDRPINNKPQFIVKNTITALGQLASYYTSLIKPVTIGITGTNGKTTVTNLIASILRQCNLTLQTYKNYNNQIGLPLSIFRAEKKTKFFVLEMGASKNGDIQELTNIVKPKIVALLNVSLAHLDSFKTLENIIITKEEILDNQGYKKIVILNIDDPNYQRWEAKSKNNIVKTISQNQHADYYLQSNTSSNLLIKTYKGDELNIDNNKLEKHEIYNILFSIACSMEAGATSNNVIQGLKNARDIRGRFFKINGYNKSNIIDSTYNANPESFKAAICSLSKINGKKWLIMGDMGELGKDARKYHIEIGDFAKKNKVEKIFLISKYSKEIKKNFGDGSYSFLTTSELIEFIKPMITEDVNILIKASRFMKFEVIVDALSIGKY